MTSYAVIQHANEGHPLANTDTKISGTTPTTKVPPDTLPYTRRRSAHTPRTPPPSTKRG